MADRRLTPEDWVIAAMVALAEGGLDGVRVERLARRLKTSKGSFYWHFADRPALLAALVDRWESEGTTDVIRSAEAMADPAERLRHVTQAALVPERHGIAVHRFEAARRAWAAEDAAVGDRLRRIDERRAAFLSAQLIHLGYGPAEAGQLGMALYLALLGLYATRAYAPALADDANLLALVEKLIAAAPGDGPSETPAGVSRG